MVSKPESLSGTVIAEGQTLPLPLPEENEAMPKTTVAQLETRVEELESLVSQLLTIDAYQGRTLAEVRRSDKEAHDRLDKARDVIKELKDAPQPTRHRQTNRNRASCEVNGCPGHRLPETSVKHLASVKAKSNS